MLPDVTEAAIPANTKIAGELNGAYFYDCHQMDYQHEGISAMQVFLNAFGNTPAWVDFLMQIRNRVVSLFGLKDLGQLRAILPAKTAADYRIGDQVGIFSLIYQSEQEVILCDCDKHLDVKVSLSKQSKEGRQFIAVTTVVHVHNMLGKVYMFFVGPAHKVIAPAVIQHAKQ
ncbi:DUF2867 domain-containing protein [Undibacterium rugosum]|uniref:DUF2867 domain-containing protein n=1 Tax=Undibacterium rugosum TaxID=2762291 RepID=UPI001B81EA2E|nr:DUF2867 domain-containing protein [Undibacterium rugosum]MBR7778082.1 DUF2867 domain-containing protein [Undibacterium rugosum]